MISGWLFLGLIALVVAAVFLEGRRQQRRYGKPRGAALMRAGMLELQHHLEPEKHVEFLLEEPTESDAAQPGEPPKPNSSN